MPYKNFGQIKEVYNKPQLNTAVYINITVKA